MSADCIFCKIIAGVIPSPRVYEDEGFICIRDIQPQAKVHLLVIPKEHFDSMEEVYKVAIDANGNKKSEILLGKMMGIAVLVARETGLLPAGFRSVINTGVGGGQSVFHLHLHVLGGALKDTFA